ASGTYIHFGAPSTVLHPRAVVSSGNQLAFSLGLANVACGPISALWLFPSHPLSSVTGRNRVLPGARRLRTTAAIHGRINPWLDTTLSSVPCVAPGSMANFHGAPAARPLFQTVSASSVPATSSSPPAIRAGAR